MTSEQQQIQQLEGRLELMLDTLTEYEDQVEDLKTSLETQMNLYGVLVENANAISEELMAHKERQAPCLKALEILFNAVTEHRQAYGLMAPASINDSRDRELYKAQIAAHTAVHNVEGFSWQPQH